MKDPRIDEAQKLARATMSEAQARIRTADANIVDQEISDLCQAIANLASVLADDSYQKS
jgi:hypothetical protein